MQTNYVRKFQSGSEELSNNQSLSVIFCSVFCCNPEEAVSYSENLDENILLKSNLDKFQQSLQMISSHFEKS